ncbi:YIP1 family protein [Chryseobacterium sp. VD8]|uniref:YIP1 family protein n=1 Tax=Chryseobacterium sp. VD8 TaxID=3081254 RepID=UPI00301AD80C
MNWQTLFNPFSKFSEKTLLVIGAVTGVFLIISCYFTQTKMDSLLHFSSGEGLNLVSISLYVLISLVYAVLLLFGLGKIFNKRTRLIDIANTVLVSQIPVLFTVISTKLFDIEKLSEKISQTSAKDKIPDINILDLISLTVFAFANLILIIYSFTLLFNGFKTATNIKKWQQIAIFAFVTLLGILICQIILPQFSL